jgi:hypothetical protein
MNKSNLLGAEQWHQIIEGQRSSGLTVAAYCRDRGVTEGSFYTWKRRLRSPAKSNRSSAPEFVEVKPPSASAVGAIEICLHGERRLLVRGGFDPDLLMDLVRTLEGTA